MVQSLYALMEKYAPPPPDQQQRPGPQVGVPGALASPAACDYCGGIGYIGYEVPITHPKFGALDPCPRCQGPARLARLRTVSRLSGDLLEKTLDNFQSRRGVENAVEMIKNWMRQNAGAGWLTLSGPPGTGKTHLCAAIVNHYLAVGIPAIYTSMAELLDDLRQTQQPGSDVIYSQLFATILDVEVLVLDEIEKWKQTEWAMEQVFRLAEWRSRDRKFATVLATNADLRSDDLFTSDGPYSGYLESRIRGGVLSTDFWRANDFRSELARARTDRLFE